MPLLCLEFSSGPDAAAVGFHEVAHPLKVGLADHPGALQEPDRTLVIAGLWQAGSGNFVNCIGVVRGRPRTILGKVWSTVMARSTAYYCLSASC